MARVMQDLDMDEVSEEKNKAGHVSQNLLHPKRQVGAFALPYLTDLLYHLVAILGQLLLRLLYWNSIVTYQQRIFRVSLLHYTYATTRMPSKPAHRT